MELLKRSINIKIVCDHVAQAFQPVAEIMLNNRTLPQAGKPVLHRIVLIPFFTQIVAVTVFVLFATGIHAQGEADLKAENLTIEQTDEGISLVLEGPVEASYGDDHISSDSAVVYLGSDLSNLYAAIETIELTGHVGYSGAGNTSGSAGQATYYADDQRIVLSGSAGLSRGTFSASAGTVDYRIKPGIVTLNGGCRLSQDTISATGSRAEYNLIDKTGSLAGSVRIVIRTGGILFGDEEISEVVISSDAIYLSVDEGIVRTPEGPEARRTSVVAGNFNLDADRVIFTGGSESVDSITAEGAIVIDGPDLHVEADRISLATVDRILKVEGNVVFSIMGQEGSADEVELNFAAGWSIRLVGASVGGTLDDELLNSVNPDSDNQR